MSTHPHGHGHGHDHGHGHPHGHSHGHHHHAAPNDWRYGAAIVLNLGFVAAEVVFGLISHSTALLADAGHNLSDVLGLALAGAAAWLAKQSAAEHKTYGYGKTTILAALANAIVLVFACGAIAMEAVGRFMNPEPVGGVTVMAVAFVGFLINGATALMFMRGREKDLNVRGAFLHMAADAAVSLGVVVVGGGRRRTALHRTVRRCPRPRAAPALTGPGRRGSTSRRCWRRGSPASRRATRAAGRRRSAPRSRR